VDVGAWLRELDLEQYEAAFRENGVSEKDLPHLTAEDLQDLGIVAVGHRPRYYRRGGAAVDALILRCPVRPLPPAT